MSETNGKKGALRHGLRMRTVNIAACAVILLLSLLLIVLTGQVSGCYREMREITDRIILCQQNAALFRETSDYLTGEARAFAATGDPVHAENFFRETDTDRRREQAIASVDDYLSDPAAMEALNRALTASNDLVEVERRSFRLAAEGYGVAPASLPEKVTETELSPEDAGLSPEEMRAVALSLLFDGNYLGCKSTIYENVDSSIHALIRETHALQEESAARLSLRLRQQRIIIFLLFLFMLLIVVFYSRIIILPLRESVRRIRAGEKIPEQGVFEMRFLARSFNDFSHQSESSRRELHYSATHDALTGLYNRKAFEDFRRELDETNAGVLAMDIDRFKQINDRYGHHAGDAALVRVARVLKASFRVGDFICRVGGDEFFVIMAGASSRLTDLVRTKVKEMNDQLSQPEGECPALTLSVGAAFGDRKNPAGDIFRDADAALYNVKEHGRGGCAFY